MSLRPLRLVHAERELPPHASVCAGFGYTQTELLVRFEVRGFECVTQPDWGGPGSGPHWGLWETDVVEVFLADTRAGGLGAHLPYYEFQVSPLGQYFELLIQEPRKKVDREYRSDGRFSATQVGERAWDASVRIPWSAIGGMGIAVIGNAFAILGERGARSYWSLFTAPQTVPDFHVPQDFSLLLNTRTESV